MNKSMPHVNKAKFGLSKQAPLGVKGAIYLDWVNLDQIYNVILEQWPLMRHNIVLDGDGWCERSDFIEGGLGFAGSKLIKGRGW